MARSQTAGDSSSTDSPSNAELRKRRNGDNRLENLDYPRAAANIDSTTTDESDSDGLNSDSEGGRRETEKTGRESSTMHSISKWTGVQRTQMRHLLSPGKTSDPTLAPPLDEKKLDPEAQSTSAELNYRQNEKALSWKRKIYISGTVLLCVLLIVVGIVLGLKATREREEEESKGFSPALAADHALLVAQGEEMQAQLAENGAAVVDHSKDEVHQIAEYGTVNEHEGEVNDQPEEEEEEEEEEFDSVAEESDPVAKIAIPISSTAGVPLPLPSSPSHGKTTIVAATEPALVHQSFPDLQNLFEGNEKFINETNTDSPGLLQKLGLGQIPKFATLGCSDSRVSETLITGSKVGDLFVTRNIGNQYVIDSLSTESVFSYAISHLGVSHLIVLGHTKCGAVLASIVSESRTTMSDIGENRIMTWIRPIRSLYQTSTRSEIVNFRNSMKKKKEILAQDVSSQVWNALIEENVKQQVKQLATDPSVLKSWKLWGESQMKFTDNQMDSEVRTKGEKEKRSSGGEEEKAPIELWIHGWVYDVSTGLVHDLGVSVGPRMK
ncbi:hypothetical protein JCM5350_004425 [Sporobolomyces pararoseus]